MLSNRSLGLRHFDGLKPEPSQEEALFGAVCFRRFHHKILDLEGTSVANIYTIDFPSQFIGYRFGMHFSAHGDYCVNLARKVDNRLGGRLISAMNCNFGFIADEADRLPDDISYNLHLEDGHLVQLPVADKTALLVDSEGRLSMRFLVASGTLSAQGRTHRWIGSLSKSTPTRCIQQSPIITYNSFNRGLLQLDDPITRTKKTCDPSKSHTLQDAGRTDIILSNKGGQLSVSAVNPNTRTHLFSGTTILSVQKQFAASFPIGSVISEVTIGGISLRGYTHGATVGALLTPDANETEANISASQIFQTRHQDGSPVISRNPKFCRACIVLHGLGVSWLLVDARKGIKGQEGATIEQLRMIVKICYPDFHQFANVDGGHAAKLVIKRELGMDVFGNLHYKQWPKSPNGRFRWDGYRGRKIPAILYAYQI